MRSAGPSEHIFHVAGYTHDIPQAQSSELSAAVPMVIDTPFTTIPPLPMLHNDDDLNNNETVLQPAPSVSSPFPLPNRAYVATDYGDLGVDDKTFVVHTLVNSPGFNLLELTKLATFHEGVNHALQAGFRVPILAENLFLQLAISLKLRMGAKRKCNTDTEATPHSLTPQSQQLTATLFYIRIMSSVLRKSSTLWKNITMPPVLVLSNLWNARFAVLENDSIITAFCGKYPRTG
ncbi:hypothetical protein C8R45DRAFT_920705 [Mycena sanguinolenta]|nr:hypothetical protein C8R45DRAFT_920705 [Mycena sanguinolenta]